MDEEKKERYFHKSYTLKNTDETKAYYSKWAKVYDLEVSEENGYRQPQRCAEALLNLLEPGDSPILDVGCGTGLSGQALASAGYTNIDGCDLSPEMLEKAAKTLCYKRLFEANLNQPPLNCEDSTYDAATAVGVFSFGHIDPAAIDEILRVLKPGGALIIGLNEKFYDEGSFPMKLDALEQERKIEIKSREHGIHLENIEGSMGWVIGAVKI